MNKIARILVIGALVTLPFAAFADGNFYAFGTIMFPCGAAPCDCAWSADALPKQFCSCDPGETACIEQPYPANVAGECTGGTGEGDGVACVNHSTCFAIDGGYCTGPIAFKLIARTTDTNTGKKIYGCVQMQVSPPPGNWGLITGTGVDVECVGASVPASALSGIQLNVPAVEADDETLGVPCSPAACGGLPGVVMISNPTPSETLYPDQSTSAAQFYFSSPTWATLN